MLKQTTTIMLPVFALLAACGPEAGEGNLPGNVQDDQPFAQIGEGEVIKLSGTEPFWGGDVDGEVFTYATPENIDGQEIAVTRFAGRGGLSFAGELDGASVDLAVTPGECSDGMSDAIYPLTATLQIGEDQRQGCAWSDAHPMIREAD